MLHPIGCTNDCSVGYARVSLQSWLFVLHSAMALAFLEQIWDLFSEKIEGVFVAWWLFYLYGMQSNMLGMNLDWRWVWNLLLWAIRHGHNCWTILHVSADKIYTTLGHPWVPFLSINFDNAHVNLGLDELVRNCSIEIKALCKSSPDEGFCGLWVFCIDPYPGSFCREFCGIYWCWFWWATMCHWDLTSGRRFCFLECLQCDKVRAPNHHNLLSSTAFWIISKSTIQL